MTSASATSCCSPIYDAVQGSGANFEYDVDRLGRLPRDRLHRPRKHGTVEGHFVRVIWEGIRRSPAAGPRTSAFAPSTRRITTKDEERKETLMTYRVKNITIAVALALVAAL